MKVKKIKPMFNHILVTADKYEENELNSTIIDLNKMAGALKEYQKVVAVGDTVKSIKEGDLVVIDPTRYAKMKHQEGSLKDGVITDNPVISYNFPIVEVDSKDYILLYDADVKYIIQEFEEDAPKSTIIKQPKIIV